MRLSRNTRAGRWKSGIFVRSGYDEAKPRIEHLHLFQSQGELGVACSAILIAHKIQAREYSRDSDIDGKLRILVGCWRNSNGNLYVPYSNFDDDNRKLNHNWIDNDWNDNWSFVAFCDSSA